MKIVKHTVTVLLLVAAAFCAHAQDEIEVDSLVYRPVSAVDSSLYGMNIWSCMPPEVKLVHPIALSEALDKHIEENSQRTVNGYRIRIYFESSQNARSESEKVVASFRAKFYGMNAYRSYSNPFFKVTVGDFRTKSEASLYLKIIQNDFPSAFIVKEKIRFPDLDPESFVVDTIKIFKEAEETLEL